MRNLSKYLSIYIILLAGIIQLNAQDWQVSDKESDELSFFQFDEERTSSGEQQYNASCVSCHGTPTAANYAAMVPPPGDVAGDVIQAQTDGAIFHKIKQGRGAMPGFSDAFSDEEVWNLVAYIRSFNDDYKQELPNMEGLEIPELFLTMEYDDNVDKIVVKVKDTDSLAIKDASVSAYVQGMFGNLLLGKSKTNELGIAWFDIDAKLPGDLEGNVAIIAKATKGYGSAKLTQHLQAATPTIKKSAIEGRHLWSKASKAPIWMIIIFNLIGVGVWGAILYILFGLRKLKKLK